jgi:hypothetical protein
VRTHETVGFRELQIDMEAIVVDVGSKLLKAGFAIPDQTPAMVIFSVPPFHHFLIFNFVFFSSYKWW